jgi:hypothetical protein
VIHERRVERRVIVATALKSKSAAAVAVRSAWPWSSGSVGATVHPLSLPTAVYPIAGYLLRVSIKRTRSQHRK